MKSVVVYVMALASQVNGIHIHADSSSDTCKSPARDTKIDDPHALQDFVEVRDSQERSRGSVVKFDDSLPSIPEMKVLDNDGKGDIHDAENDPKRNNNENKPRKKKQRRKGIYIHKPDAQPATEIMKQKRRIPGTELFKSLKKNLKPTKWVDHSFTVDCPCGPTGGHYPRSDN